MGALRHPDPWSRSTLANPTLDSGSQFQNANSRPPLPAAFLDFLLRIIVPFSFFSQRPVETDESGYDCSSREGCRGIFAANGDVEDPGVLGFGPAHSLFLHRQFSRARELRGYEEVVGGGSVHGSIDG